MEWSRAQVKFERTLQMANRQVVEVRGLADDRVTAERGTAAAAVAAAEERAASRAQQSARQLDELNERLWDEEAKTRASERDAARSRQQIDVAEVGHACGAVAAQAAAAVLFKKAVGRAERAEVRCAEERRGRLAAEAELTALKVEWKNHHAETSAHVGQLQVPPWSNSCSREQVV